MASQQTPARPWFRLASLARPAPAPAPAPQPPLQPSAPQPRPSFPRPTFVQTFRPPVPQPQESAAPPPPPPPATTPSVPSSPVIRVSAPSSLPTSPAAAPTVSSSSVPPSPIPIPKTSSPSSGPTSPPAPKSSPAPKALPSAPSSSVPPSPKINVVSVAPTSGPSSVFLRAVSSSPPPPPPSPMTAALTAAIPARPAPAPAPAPAPTSSPKILKSLAKTPPPSPKIKPIAGPPSPLTLPPAQIKSESGPDLKGIPAVAQQKSILVQETSEKPKMLPKAPLGDLQRQTGETDRWGNGENRKWEVKKGVVERKDRDMYKKSSESEENGMSIVTIAGENKGAIMELSPSGQINGFRGKPHALQKTDNQVVWSEGEKSSSSSDEDGRSKGKGKSLKSMGKTSAGPMKAFMNSNVQSVNSSIMFNSSCTHHDPGVHLSLSRKPKAGPGMQPRD